jgi:hypothetical protein
MLKSWLWERFSLGLAIGFAIAIFLTISRYDGRSVDDWPLSITMNTFIALLSTILRAAMMVTVTAIIGQLKWT